MSVRFWVGGLAAFAGFVLLTDSAIAQLAHHPFAVGASEGAVGHQSGLGAWILGMESRFYLQLTGAVRAAKTTTSGALLLVGLSFAYGVFHAAGPGHGKAVITSYMVSNEVALRRGLLIALAAAIMQGVVATAIVGLAAFVFHATAARMTAASQIVELASYIGIVALGALLVWRKGRALWMAISPVSSPRRIMLAAVLDGHSRNSLMVRAGGAGVSNHEAIPTSLRLEPSWFETPPPFGIPAIAQRSRFSADDGTTHRHDETCGCGHAHMPDPSIFAAPRFDWRAAGLAVVTAGARPCSGAILVLVFSLAQGLFLAGVAATFAMALGTAITTGLLATAAVFAKDLAMRLSGGGSPKALVAGRLVEFGAAACVLVFGLLLLTAALSGVHGGA